MKEITTVILLSFLLFFISPKSVSAWELLGLHQVTDTDTATRMSVFFGFTPPCTSILYKNGSVVANGGDSYPYLCSEWQLFPGYILTSGIYQVFMTDSKGLSFTSTEYSIVVPTPTITAPSLTSTPTPTVPTVIPTPTLQPKRINALSPVHTFLGLRNATDLTVKFDLRAEVYMGTTLVTSGQINSLSPKMSLFGFKGPERIAIPLSSFTQREYPADSALQIKLLVRNACVGSLRNSGTARLWFNGKEANSKVAVTVDTKKQDFFLRDNFRLLPAKGSDLTTIDVDAGARCSQFKSFGTWTTVL